MATAETPLLAADDDDSLSITPSTSTSSSDRKRTLRQRTRMRYASFATAIVSCLCAGSLTAFSLYGHLFQERLGYKQMQVNMVMITAELAMYGPVPVFGYLCDRIGPAPLSLLAAILFSAGYILAAFTYRAGESSHLGLGHYVAATITTTTTTTTTAPGWSLGFMVVAFALIGMATTCMYVGAVTTCAKNFGRGKYKGLALASPIAAFGLSGFWQSQFGSRILYERHSDGSRGDVDVFKYFVFLAVTLGLVGLLGTFTLKIVGEDELIDEAVEELERSGLLEDSAFFRRSAERGYGSFNDNASDGDSDDQSPEEERKKTWLLNEETRLFINDRTAWWLALGFLLISGPGEAFLTNLGTIIGTLNPPITDASPKPTTAATHVSIVAITSTIARILCGTLTDILAPTPATHHYQSVENSLSSLPPPAPAPPLSRRRRLEASRITFVLGSAVCILLGAVFLASGLVQTHAERFWIVSTLMGVGYGALFSLMPLIVSVIWGVENFGTNWGMMAMMPALGATAWGLVYSSLYQRAAERSQQSATRLFLFSFHSLNPHPTMTPLANDVLCYGQHCYALTFWLMAVSVACGCLAWAWAWKGPSGWSKRGIAI